MSLDPVDAIKCYIVFLVSTSFHEAAHAWSALRLGDATAARGGQVSLNPAPHVRREPVGMVLVPLLSLFGSGSMFGWGSAPYDPEWARLHPRRAAAMALAGPASNFLLLIAAALALRIGFEWGLFHGSASPSFFRIAYASGDGWNAFAATLLSLAFSLNLLLACFNLIPLPPFDGSALPLLFLPPAAGEKYAALRRQPGLAWGGVLAAVSLSSAFFPPTLRAAAAFLHLNP